ncbi:MAG TPA: hypothetical protein DIT01_04270, partial [Lentisphaeria bacterium]|nr:hypothetical protein [Lentisphaeria bacterium]
MSPEHCSSLDRADIGSPSHLGSFTPPVISMDISVVIPCYNEASYLRTSMALLTEVMCRSVLADLRIIELPALYLRRFDKQTSVRVFHDAPRCFRQLLKFQRQVGLSAMARSPVYWSPALYDVTMWLLHGRELGVATDRVAGYIEPDSEVVDVCAGTAHLAASVVARGCTYLALDFNSTFVLSARKRGIRARFHNVHTDAIPAADYVVM